MPFQRVSSSLKTRIMIRSNECIEYEYLYSRFPKGFQRVYRYLYFPFPKSITVWHNTVNAFLHFITTITTIYRSNEGIS